MASSNASSDNIYAAIYLMPLFKVADKFAAKATLCSPTFTCSEDPHQTSFQVRVEFKENQIDVQVRPTSRAVEIQRTDFKLFDEEMKCQKRARFTPPRGRRNDLYWQDKFTPDGKGFSESFLRPLPSDGDPGEFNELRLFVDVRYNAELLVQVPDSIACLEDLSFNTGDLFDPSYVISNYDVEIDEDFDFCIRVEDEKISCHKVIRI